MNERIAQLAEEATYEMEFGGPVLQTTNDEISYEIPAGFIEAFATLIIRKCAAVAQMNTPDTEECEYTHLVSEKIKEHFGVEE
jgi:hypothetical protein